MLILFYVTLMKVVCKSRSRFNDFERKRIFTVAADITVEDGLNFLLEKSLDYVNEITSAVHSAYPVSAGWGTSFEDLQQRYLNQDLDAVGQCYLFSRKILGYLVTTAEGTSSISPLSRVFKRQNLTIMKALKCLLQLSTLQLNLVLFLLLVGLPSTISCGTDKLC